MVVTGGDEAQPATATAQRSTTQHNTAQHSTAQHSTASTAHSTTQHDTTKKVKGKETGENEWEGVRPTGLRLVLSDFDQATIDHIPNAIDCDAGLCDVCGQNDFARVQRVGRRLEHCHLLVGRQSGVQRQHQVVRGGAGQFRLFVCDELWLVDTKRVTGEGDKNKKNKKKIK